MFSLCLHLHVHGSCAFPFHVNVYLLFAYLHDYRRTNIRWPPLLPPYNFKAKVQFHVLTSLKIPDLLNPKDIGFRGNIPALWILGYSLEGKYRFERSYNLMQLIQLWKNYMDMDASVIEYSGVKQRLQWLYNLVEEVVRFWLKMISLPSNMEHDFKHRVLKVWTTNVVFKQTHGWWFRNPANG